MPPTTNDDSALWPELPYAAWKDTYATLHLWTQIVGKIRLAQTPWLDHSWHVTLHVSPRGLTTSVIPSGHRTFQLEFDFSRHVLRASTDNGSSKEIALFPRSVAQFYADVRRALSELGIDVHIFEMPNEIPEPIRFSEDRSLFVRPHLCAAALANSPSGQSGVLRVPDRLHRQMQSGPFLLGQL